jgi:hypothetical protein
MKIDFEYDTKYGKFVDALYFDDQLIPSDAEINAMKQERVDNWIAHIDAASQRPPLSKYTRDAEGNLLLDVNGDPILVRV